MNTPVDDDADNGFGGSQPTLGRVEAKLSEQDSAVDRVEADLEGVERTVQQNLPGEYGFCQSVASEEARGSKDTGDQGIRNEDLSQSVAGTAASAA